MSENKVVTTKDLAQIRKGKAQMQSKEKDAEVFGEISGDVDQLKKEMKFLVNEKAQLVEAIDERFADIEKRLDLLEPSKPAEPEGKPEITDAGKKKGS